MTDRGSPSSPLRTLRLVFRLLAFALWTGLIYVYCVVGVALATPFGAWRRWRNHAIHVWSWLLVHSISVRIETSGVVPRGGCLIVSNHLSYLDVIVLGAICPTSFVAKAEVRNWPVMGWITRTIGIVFVSREDRRSLPAVAARMATELEHGSSVVFFPEGTTTDGSQILPFKPSLLAPAAEGRLPVAHVTIHYRTPDDERPAREAVCWWGDMSFFTHFIGLMKLSRVRAIVRFGDEQIVDGDRKVLARELHQRVVARFDPDVPPVDAAETPDKDHLEGVC